MNWASSHIFCPSNCWVKESEQKKVNLEMNFSKKKPTNIFAFYVFEFLTSQILPQSKVSLKQSKQKLCLGKRMNSLENRHINRLRLIFFLSSYLIYI